jgi:hypothetical protein
MQWLSGGLAAVFCVLGLAALAGCTQEEKLFRVSGEVTHNGKPVPKGNIFFDPKVEGPQGYASIVDGKFDTAKLGKGVRGGSYDVRVNGFNGIEGPEAPLGQPLFPEYTGTADLPPEDSTYNLDVKTR